MDTKLREYAKLVIEMGLNVQKDQDLVIRAPVQSAEFARLCAAAAYDVGCREVLVDFSDDELTRLRYLHANDAVFDEVPQWIVEKYNAQVEHSAALLSIAARDPNALQGVDPARIRRASQASGKALDAYYQAMMSNKMRWCVACVPVPAWAEKVFPDETGEAAMNKLWDAIYETMRITGDGKAVERWQEHTRRVHARCEQLNAMGLTTLRYQNALGTDLTCGLPEGAFWAGGAEEAADGVSFVANMPTEEIFTAPHRERVNGRVVSSMPFVLNGTVIDRFAFVFENGKIVGIETEDAAQREMLQNAISVDEGASYLGEVALVPFDSPISQQGILYYNTLFDENASCHLAFGNAYPCVKGAENMNNEERRAIGLNDSFAHHDFMVGTSDLSIVGTKADGTQVDIFVNGSFAF